MNIDTNGLTKAFDGDSIYDNAVYHTMTASWIVPQNDPYKLSNFQIALDNLLSGKSDVVLTESIRNTLSDFFNLSPTHYALKVYPRNEDEQWRIESMDDVKVSYIPLNYIQLTDNQVKKANLNDTSKHFNEEYRYTFTYTDIICDDEKVEDETITMPILYVVWPKQKELPKDIDYTLDYEVFIPDHSSDNNQAMGILEDEAIRLALGKRIKTKTVNDRNQMRIGTVKYGDSFYGGYVPMAYLKIRFQLGSYIAETYTDSEGTFYASPQLIDDAATWSIVLQHTYWKITSMSSTTPYVSSMGTVGDTWATSNEIFCGLVYDSVGYFAVHPAVSFYYNGDHEIQTASYDSGIRIKVSPDTHPDALSSFSYFVFSAAYITIYQNAMDTPNYLNGAILHELGHFTQYRAKGTILNYTSTKPLIRESYADYVGNYLCDRYYTLLGWSNPSPYTGYTGCAEQNWVKTGNSIYSPLFVDLFDNFNQSSINSSYNNDSIYGFNHSIVRQISANCKTWGDVKNILDDYIGVYYTQGQYNDYIAPYDYWFTNN